MKRRSIHISAPVALMALVLAALVSCGKSEQTAPSDQTTAPFPIVETTIADIQRAILAGHTTCRAVVQAYLARIKTYDKPTKLNAITVVNPRALSRADEIDSAIQAGKTLGPLFCAPLLVKDNYDTHDLPTTGGSIAMKDNIPPTDAFVVGKLRRAGAIVIAKTNMAEWAFSPRQTVSSSYGVTANAYALDRVPAGSSGGTASGVAANFGVAGLGTDTGNSIRGPASHLGLFGIRATIGLVSRDGIIPLAFDRDVPGPLARTVEDGARLLNVMAGYDPADRFTAEIKGKTRKDYTQFLVRDGLKGARIGVLRALVDTKDADRQVTALFEKAIDDLRAAGAVIIDPVKVANFEDHLKNQGFCPRFRYDMHIYLRSLGDEAPLKDVMEVLKTGQYSPYIKKALAFFAGNPLDVPPEKWDKPCPAYLDHPARKAFLNDVTAAMDADRLDVLIYPTWTNPPAHLDQARKGYKGDNSQLVAPATGMPAATVPMGYTYDVLPAGLQILARRYDESTIFKIAYAYEQATKHRHPPKGYPELSDGVAAQSY